MSRIFRQWAGSVCALLVVVGYTISTAATAQAQRWYEGNCKCTDACGCGTGVPIPGTYDPDGDPGDLGQFDQPGDDAGTTGSFDQPSPQLSQQFGGGSQQFVTNFAPPSIGDSFSPAVKVQYPSFGTFETFAVPDGVPIASFFEGVTPPAGMGVAMSNGRFFVFSNTSSQQLAASNGPLTETGPGGTFTAFDTNSTVPFDQSGTTVNLPLYEVRSSNGYSHLCVPTPSGAAVLGRTKIADNNSPIPRNRLFFDYNYFHNAALVPGGIGLHRFAPGFESTMFDGLMSVEMRVPMGVTVNSDLVTDFNGNYLGDLEQGELGNLQFMLKALLLEGPFGALAAGLSVTAPTANDVSVDLANGTPLILVENQAVHVMPYVALLRRYGPDVFTQFSLQLDIDSNGNAVSINQLTGNGLEFVGRLDDQNLIYFDATVGAWIHRDPSAPLVNGVALALEAHYTGTLEDQPSIAVGNVMVGNPAQNFDMVNLTCGCHIAIGRNLVTVGYGVPVTEDRVFEGEARVFVNRYY